MCVAPVLIPSGQEIACRKCWQCRAAKVDDWVGRNIAEARTSIASHSVTLTYGRDELGNEDHVRAKVLTYSDVQKYLRALRDAGYPVRYFAVGEYGSEKGRAHWHMMLYWQQRVPDITLDKRVSSSFWPHGFVFFEEPHEYAVRYICKYITKDVSRDGEHLVKPRMSKKPPLGDAYFKERARQFVHAGLAPQDEFYSFPDVLDKKGKAAKFRMKGATLDNFIGTYVAAWSFVRPLQPMPYSEMIEDWLDCRAARRDAEEPRFDPRPRPLKKPTVNQLRPFMKMEDVKQSQLGTWEYRIGRSYRWYWTRFPNGDDGWKFVDVDKVRGINLVEDTKTRRKNKPQ